MTSTRDSLIPDGPNPKSALVAMSGGVDSSVTARLLLDQGCVVEGVTFEQWGGPVLAKMPRSGSARDDASRVCSKLGIRHHVIDVSDAFHSKVVRAFIDDYCACKTPNPCIYCNRFIKFGVLDELRRQLGLSWLATGHYARVVHEKSVSRLLKAYYVAKDQSYFLYCISQDVLKHVLFPLGHVLNKGEVRAMAEAAGFVNARKPDSQEICFIPDDDYAGFLEGPGGVEPSTGPVVHVDGRVLGVHRGLHRYTTGQRRGLGIASREPLYVVSRDPVGNRLVVGPKSSLEVSRVRAVSLQWTRGVAVEPGTLVQARIRYRSEAAPALVTVCESGSLEVEFQAPVSGVSEGQSLVLYSGDEVIGGGLIDMGQTLVGDGKER